jgi:hypothetical protein
VAHKSDKKTKDNGDSSEHSQRALPVLLVFIGLFLLFWLALGTLHTFSPLEQEIRGVDPVGYYAWPRSILFDRDLDFHNEYRTLNPPRLWTEWNIVRPNQDRTPTGKMPNAFSIGPGLLWTPFLLIAHILAIVGGAPADGFSQPYQSAVFFANLFYGLAGAILTFYFIRTWFDKRVSAVAAIAAWTCSPALYYTYAQEAMSHAGSFFCTALVLLLWARWRTRDTFWPWAIIGIALGLNALVRWQNVTLCIIPAVDLLWTRKPRDAAKLALAAATTVITFFPQLIGWKILYGSFLTIPQGGGFMDWTHPNPLKPLFSGEYGLITWTPLCALGIVGIFLWPKADRRIYIALAAAFLAQMYIQSIAGNVGWSFSMRRLVNCVPLFAVGYALILQRLGWRMLGPSLIVAVFAFWNLLFALQYGGFIDPLYVDQAMTTLAREQGVSAQALPEMAQLPSGEPFEFTAFVQEHRFPRGTSPTLRQFTTDKFVVFFFAGYKLLGGG